MEFQDALLWLFVINLGIVFGAGLYEARMVVPIWASSPAESLQSADLDSGRKFWVFTTTITLTLLTVANAAAAWSVQGGVRAWWIAAVLIVGLERLMTFSYFIPTIVRLQRASASHLEGKAAMARWSKVNYLRNALTLLAWLAALKALVIAV